MTLDPTRALAEIRAAVHEIRKLIGVSDDPLAELADHLATLIEGLDGYLAGGGFVPDQWLPTRLAMLQAEYRRGFEAAMLRNRADRLRVPAAPIHATDPLGGPHPGITGHLPEDQQPGGHDCEGHVGPGTTVCEVCGTDLGPARTEAD